MKKKNEARGFMRVVEGVNSSVIYLIHCKKLCKCHTVPPPSTIKEKKERKKYFSNIIPLNSPDSLV
jgi:hypothetical protein